MKQDAPRSTREKAEHILHRLKIWQGRIRTASRLLPLRQGLPLLTPAPSHGPDLERFHQEDKNLIPWRDKQAQSWGFSGNLETGKKRPFGFRLSFFDRQTQDDFIGVVPMALLKTHISAAHFALIDPLNGRPEKTFRFWQHGGLIGKDRGFAAADRLHLVHNGWHAHSNSHVESDAALGAEQSISLFASGGNESLCLELHPKKKLVYHGQSGYAQRGADAESAALHCSYTRMEAKGWLLIDGRLEDVSGQAWMDHQKLSVKKEPTTTTLDWISLQFDSGEELMLQLAGKYTSGSWIDAAGTRTHLITADIQVKTSEYWESHVTGARYPVKREIEIQSLGLRLQVRATLRNQEIDCTLTALETRRSAYWIGLVSGIGEQRGRPLEASGYTELTGYDTRPRSKVFDFLVY